MTTRRIFIKEIAAAGIMSSIPAAGFPLSGVSGRAKPSVTYPSGEAVSFDVPSLEELGLFDSCVTLGRFTAGNCISSADELLSVMDRYFIREALVHDYHARCMYPYEDGNRRLLSSLQGNVRLHPVWILEPPAVPGPKAAELIVSDMLSSGVRVARLRISNKGLFLWLWEDLLNVLDYHHIPCFFDFGTPLSTIATLTDHDVDALQFIVKKYPGLPIVLSHVVGGLGIHPAALYPIYRSKNLYLDITGVLEYWRTIAYDVGPERILFATGMPFSDPGILVSNVQYALDLDTRAKKMICGDNLRRLMKGVR